MWEFHWNKGNVQGRIEREIREKEEEKTEARTRKPLEKQWENSMNGPSLSLKGTFVPAYIYSDIETIGHWAGQGTSWARPGDMGQKNAWILTFPSISYYKIVEKLKGDSRWDEDVGARFSRLLPVDLGCWSSLGDLRKLGCWSCSGVSGCFTAVLSVEVSGVSWTWQDIGRAEDKVKFRGKKIFRSW